MTYTIYDPATGKITHHVTASTPELIELNLAGQNYVEGFFDGKQYYIEHGHPQVMPVPPKSQNVSYEFDWQQKTWVINLDNSAQLVRQQRNTLLQDVDRVNPIWYADLNQDQQQELQQYRQALLAIPQQAGFPDAVEWPTKPQWL